VFGFDGGHYIQFSVLFLVPSDYALARAPAIDMLTAFAFIAFCRLTFVLQFIAFVVFSLLWIAVSHEPLWLIMDV